MEQTKPPDFVFSWKVVKSCESAPQDILSTFPTKIQDGRRQRTTQHTAQRWPRKHANRSRFNKTTAFLDYWPPGLVRPDRVAVRHSGNHVPTHEVWICRRILEPRHCDGSAGYSDQVHAVEQGQRRSERPERQSDEYQERKPEKSLKSDMRDLKWQMEELTQKVDQLMNSHSRPESRSSNPAPRPWQRSQSGNRPEGTRYPFRNDTCYYHFKFGDQATRCESPCKMRAGNDQARH